MIASRSVLKRVNGATGPKVSSFMRRAVSGTSRSKVGSKNDPPRAWRLAADRQACTATQRVGDVFLDLLYRVCIDERPDRHALFHAIPHYQCSDRMVHARGKRIVNYVLHEYSVGTNAGLTRVTEFRCH